MTAVVKRAWRVSVPGYPVFTMIMDGLATYEEALATARQKWPDCEVL